MLDARAVRSGRVKISFPVDIFLTPAGHVAAYLRAVRPPLTRRNDLMMSRCYALTISLLLVHAPALADAQTPASPPAPAVTTTPTVSRAVPLRGTIRIDGRLDESAWAAAPVTSGFTQIDPDEGRPASQRTEVRVLFDDAALYVGVRLHDSGPVTARLGRRDMSLGDSDWFGLMIDSYHDHRTAFGFDVNPAGVKRDEVKTINDDDNSWDAVWDVATSIDAGGWTAEYRVPFSQLRFGRESVQTWGVQFERIIGRNREYAVSTFIPKRDPGGVPRYGHLEGLSGLEPGKRLEILPYTVTRFEYVDPGLDPYRTRREYTASAGVDLRYRATSNLTLNATINPDFGQVEVDPAVVNLGVYETFFDEKRPFFLEGNEIFDFGAGGTSGGQLFYTRRIGRTPTLGTPTLEANVPQTTTILGAAKLSGKLAGWSIGSLAAVTDRETARYRDAGGIDRTQPVEPLSSYFVARARRELRDGRSLLGAVVTAVRRSLGSDVLRDNFRSDAFAGGVDFRHEWADRSWALNGDIEASRIGGTPASIVAVQTASNHFFQRPDATHLELDPDATSLFGYSMNAALAKQAGEHWRGTIAGALTSPGYEVNDLGFSYRTDRRDAELDVTYLQNRPGRVLRRWSVNASARSESNYDGDPIQTFGTVSVFGETPSYWTARLFVRRSLQAYDDRLTRGGPIAVRPAMTDVILNLASDQRMPVTEDAFVFLQRGSYEAWTSQIGFGVRLKMSSRWNLRVAPTFTRAFVPAQYVVTVPDAANTATYGQRYLFAPLDQTELGVETRLNLTFTPTLSLETYVQPLLSSGDYGSPKQLLAPRTFEFGSYGGAVPNRDFNLRSLRGNAVLRWEWRAGSTLYVAWQQSRADAVRLGDFDFERDRRALFGTRPDNIFLAKVNYWLNP